MGLVRVSFVVISLALLRIGCEGSPIAWHLHEAANTVIERRERSVDGRSGSSELPCGDDEDCDTNGDTDDFALTGGHPPPKILSMHVKTTITARYVNTVVVTRIKNRADVSLDTDFQFRLSEEAFISDFFMEVNGRIYQAEVKEKEEAQKAYNEARQRGQTAAQVKQRGDDSTKFETNINLSPNTTATFHLTFQELLRRKNGVFRHKINLHPEEIVGNLRADVYITEPQGLSFANITWEQDDSLSTDFLQDSLTITRISDTSVHATMIPSAEDQAGLSKTGLQGDLVIAYDVEHGSDAGHIEVVNGYFVHHISPEGLPRTRKNVVFVIDISGSMNGGAGSFGSKIAQTKLAMLTIIDEIRDFDWFNIICFSQSPTHWEPGLVEGTAENKARAKEFVNRISATGGTDIFGALEAAVSRLKEALAVFKEGLPMIILLTDGEPTSGITSGTEIVRRTTNMINGEMALFSLAFGASADYELLEKLSGHNQGLARKIYTDSNPSLQLEGFYNDVANPLLFNVRIRYSDGAVEEDTLTENNFICYFEGTEFVVAGKLEEDYLEANDEISAVVSGNSYDLQLEWELHKTIKKRDTGNEPPALKSHQVDDFAQRLWAYVTVKNLLHKIDMALTTTEKNIHKEKATAIALKYKFVTPLTSLIVIKPEKEKNYADILATRGEDVDFSYDVNYGAQQMQQGPPPQYSASLSYSAMLAQAPPAAPQSHSAMLAQAPPAASLSYSAVFSQPPQDAGLLMPDLHAPDYASDSYSYPVPGYPESPQVTSRVTSGTTHSQPTASVIPTVTRSQPIASAFVVRLPKESTSICFGAEGHDGLILNLINDREVGVTVNGELNTSQNSTAVRSYFSVLGFSLGKHQFTVTASEILTDIGITLSWDTETRVSFNGFVVSVVPSIGRLVIVSVNSTVMMNVSRHQEDTRAAGDRPRNHVNADHLSLYILDASGFSEEVDGLIGQFYSPGKVRLEHGEPDVGTSSAVSDDSTRDTAVLILDGTRIPVVWHDRNQRECWHAGNATVGLLNPMIFERDTLF